MVQKKPILFLPIFFLGILILNACSEKVQSDEESTEENIQISKKQFQQAGMEIGAVELVEFSEEIYATGILDVPPNRKADVSVFFGGYVKKIDRLPGEKINKGELLFILEDPSYLKMQSEFLQSKDALKYLEVDYQRQKELIKDSIVSLKQFLKAEETYHSEKARYRSLYQQLELINIDPDQVSADQLTTEQRIYSPINGTISQINLNLGSYIEASKTAVRIIGRDHMHLELKVFEQDLTKLKKGQKVIFNTQANPEQKYTAEIYLINQNIDTEDRSAHVHAHLEHDSLHEELFPGMYVEANIISNKHEQRALPRTAVIEKENSYFVAALVQQSDSLYEFQEVKVKIGSTSDEYIEIAEPELLKSYKGILTKGAYHLIQE